MNPPALPFSPARWRRLLPCTSASHLSLAVACAMPWPIQAQSVAPDRADTTLPDITVTATRQPQALTRTAAAVSVVTGAQIREAGVGINLSEALGGVPGLTVLNRQNLAQDLQISSRGFGARSTFGVRGVRLYEDGIPLTMPDGQGQTASFDLSQAQRIEVLRGPASALYGNASGGVVSVFTADGPPVPQLNVSRAMSRDATQKTSVSASGQQGDLNYVFGLAQASTAGYRDHSRATREQWHARLGWQLSEATRISLIGKHMDSPQVQDPLGLTVAQWQADPSQAGANALAYNTRKEISQGQLGLVLTHQLGAQDQLRAMAYRGQRSATQWQAIPSNLQAPATHPGGVIDLQRQFGGLDLRHLHQGSLADWPWQLSWGAQLDTLREHRQGFQNFDASGQTGVTGERRRDEINRATNRDLYLLNQLQLTPEWQASLGWRRSQVAFRSRDQYVVPGNGDDSGRIDFQADTPTASLMWQIQPGWQTYVSLGRSFETPTLNEVAYRSTDGTLTGWNTGLKAATATHREWGSKFSTGGEGRRPAYRIDAALFEVDTRDEIAVKDNSGGRSTFQNVGRTHRYGLEMAQQWRVQRDWQLNAAATWTVARYRDAFGSVKAGNTLPGVPQRVLQAEAVWQPAGQPWHAALSWRHTGRIWANDANDAAAPAHKLWAVRAVWRTLVSDWHLDALARVDNLLDARTVGSVIVNEGQRRYFEPAPGRSATLGLTLSHSFD